VKEEGKGKKKGKRKEVWLRRKNEGRSLGSRYLSLSAGGDRKRKNEEGKIHAVYPLSLYRVTGR